MKVAIIGAGAIASIHAAQLIKHPAVELSSVYSPDRREASAFASRFGIADASTSVREAIAQAAVAIVCSPSGFHFEQAKECLNLGMHTLIEMPSCADAAQAEELGELAAKHGVRVGCAHTARFLRPYESIQASLQGKKLGDVVDINYVRHLNPRARNWMDDPLLHHAAHPIDLILHWCNGFEPIGCIASPQSASAQAVSMLGRLPNGGSASIAVSYASHLPLARMLVVGTEHTVETDGFGYIRSDLPELEMQANEQETYHHAVGKQDLLFLGACRGDMEYVDWTETVTLCGTVNKAQLLSRSLYQDQS
jgi:predicted dehydrogenase